MNAFHGDTVTVDGPCGPCYGTVKMAGTESEPIALVIWDVGSILPDDLSGIKLYEATPIPTGLPLAA